MFLHRSHFEAVGVDVDTAELVAKVANQVLDKSCQVIYGEYLSNGQAHNFSTQKKRTDTHVALLLGVDIMGSLEPHDSPVALERPDKEDFERFQSERIKQLERALEIERSKK